jgi:hypothetical protein
LAQQVSQTSQTALFFFFFIRMLSFSLDTLLPYDKIILVVLTGHGPKKERDL